MRIYTKKNFKTSVVLSKEIITAMKSAELDNKQIKCAYMISGIRIYDFVGIKEIRKTSLIYVWINLKDFKKYVGQTNNLNGRIKQHLSTSGLCEAGTDSLKDTMIFHDALSKEGKASFICCIVEENYKDIDLAEYSWIKKLNTYIYDQGSLGYNSCEGNYYGISRGRKHTEAEKERQRQTLKTKFSDEKWKKYFSDKSKELYENNQELKNLCGKVSKNWWALHPEARKAQAERARNNWKKRKLVQGKDPNVTIKPLIWSKETCEPLAKSTMKLLNLKSTQAAVSWIKTIQKMYAEGQTWKTIAKKYDWCGWYGFVDRYKSMCYYFGIDPTKYK